MRQNLYRKLSVELSTHGIICDCPNKLVCENREEWLIKELERLDKILADAWEGIVPEPGDY